MQKNITKSYEKTNWIAKKTVISADLLNKIEDKLLDLDLNLANKAELNDTQVKHNATWSSNKIAKHAIEQDGVFWVEKEDNFISVDNTYEYKLKEVEIFGDTWQDKDSKNLFDINSLQMLGVNAEKSIINTEDNSITFNYENVRDYGCETNFVFKSGKKYKISADIDYRCVNHGVRFFCIDIAGKGFGYRDDLINFQPNKTNFSERVFKTTNVTIPDDDNQYVLYVNGTNYSDNVTGSTIIKNIVIEEVVNDTDLTKPTEYIPYHKGDLSNIQHVGELYVDEHGKPILDEQGRKQYKIEIESCNKNLFDGELRLGQYGLNNGIYGMSSGGNVCNKNKVRVSQNSKIYTNKKDLRIVQYNSNNEYIRVIVDYSGSNEGDGVQLDTNTNFINIYLNNNGNLSDNFMISYDKISNYIPHKSHKQTIILPCQLSRLGDIKDRLFWDESKGKYIVEKNIISFLATRITRGILDDGDYVRFNRLDDIQALIINDLLGRYDIIDSDIYIAPNIYGKDWVDVQVKKDFYCEQGYELTESDANRFLKDYPVNIITILLKPQLIETNITEPLYLPTYNNKTHIYHINNNNAKATIKAKFPLKTASAVANLNIENAKNSKDILNIQELNVNMVATNFDMDYRLLELEWALEDAGINLLNTLNIETKNNNKTLTRYEQAKIIITKHAYEYELLAKQLSRYLEKNIITQDEYNELIALMEENE